MLNENMPDRGSMSVADLVRREKGIANLEILKFRSRIDKLAKETKHPALQGIQTSDLSQEDQIFFQRFERGEMTIEGVLAQMRILENLNDLELNASKQLLIYMYNQLSLSH